MKKRVLLFLGMGSCVSAPGDQRSVNPDNSSLEAVKCSSVSPPKTAQKPKETPVTIQALVFEKPGSKDEVFFDSKAWLESDDEDFLSVNGDYSPQHQQIKNNGNDHHPYQKKNNGEHQAGRRLSDLFRESNSFSSDSQASVKANGEEMRRDEENETTPTMERKKSGAKTGQRCLPSLVRTLSCGDHKKKKLSPVHISVAG